MLSTIFLFKMTFCEVRQVCLVVFSNFLVLKETIYLYVPDIELTCTCLCMMRSIVMTLFSFRL